jgi:protein SCO1/2
MNDWQVLTRPLAAATVAALLACAGLAAPTAAPARAAVAGAAHLPRDSILQLQATLVDQSGRAFALATRAGRPQLVTMFYAHCQAVCPMIVDTIRLVENALPGAQRMRLQVLMVSLDSQRDTVPALASFARTHRIDVTRWTVARADGSGVRSLAALLGVRYRTIGGGDFSHTAAIVLLDSDGRIIARTEQIGALDPGFMAALRRTLGEKT